MSEPGDNTFSARDVFDPTSLYNRMRARYDPKLKMRGLFYELAARHQSRAANMPPVESGGTPQVFPFPLAAASPGREEKLAADSGAQPSAFVVGSDLVQIVPASVNIDFKPSNDDSAMMEFRMRLTILHAANRPPQSVACRVFFLTEGIIDRLIGPEWRESPDGQLAALQNFFAGRGRSDALAIPILAATAELNEKIPQNGVADFSIKLPALVSDFRGFPEGVVIAVVIEDHGGPNHAVRHRDTPDRSNSV